MCSCFWPACVVGLLLALPSSLLAGVCVCVCVCARARARVCVCFLAVFAVEGDQGEIVYASVCVCKSRARPTSNVSSRPATAPIEKEASELHAC